MTHKVGGSVLLVALLCFGCVFPAAAEEGPGRDARPSVPRQSAGANDPGRANDTRAAIGLSYGEVLALHKELRRLIDIHAAPSAREEEIVTRLERSYLPGTKPEVKLVEGGLAPDDVWSTQVAINRMVEHLSREGEPYLDSAACLADLMMTAINDSKTGVMVPQDGVRSPVLVKYHPPRQQGLPGYYCGDPPPVSGRCEPIRKKQTSRPVLREPFHVDGAGRRCGRGELDTGSSGHP